MVGCVKSRYRCICNQTMMMIILQMMKVNTHKVIYSKSFALPLLVFAFFLQLQKSRCIQQLSVFYFARKSFTWHEKKKVRIAHHLSSGILLRWFKRTECKYTQWQPLRKQSCDEQDIRAYLFISFALKTHTHRQRVRNTLICTTVANDSSFAYALCKVVIYRWTSFRANTRIIRNV